MPDRAGLLFVVAGVFLAAIAAMIVRRRAERLESADRSRTKQLAVQVIRLSEDLRAGAVMPSSAEGHSVARLIGDNSRYLAAVRGLRAGPCSTDVEATLSQLELARQQVLLAVVARDADFLETAVNGLDEAVESFATASSVMVRSA